MSYLLKVSISFTDGNTINVPNHDIISVICSENMTDSNVSYLPGICEQYADITVYDRNNYFHNRAMQNKSMEGEVSVYRCNSESPSSYTLIDSFDISECRIESDNSNITINGRDKVHILENLYVKEAGVANRTIHSLLTDIFAQIPGATWQYLDLVTQARCQDISLPNSWYKATIMKTLLQKVCVVGMLRIFYKKGVYYVGRCI